MILVSSCLLGINCKYSGGNNYQEKILKLVKDGKAIFACPEQLGGLTTPRLPAEIVYKDNKRYVIDKNGKDVTEEFERGAREVLKILKEMNITKVIFKSQSPSCGCGLIYDGTFTNKLIKGNGITTQLLIDNGIEVITELDI